MDGWKMSFLLGFPSFRGYVKLWGGYPTEVETWIYHLYIFIIICWTHQPKESQPFDASARFCSTESKSLGENNGYPIVTPISGQFLTNFQGSIIEEFHPPQYEDLPTMSHQCHHHFGICTRGRGQSSDHFAPLVGNVCL